MEKITSIFTLILVMILLSASSKYYTTSSKELEYEEEYFSYDEDSERGPARWGDIREEWSMCKKGRMQSPIDLSNERAEMVSHLGILKRIYRPSNATLINKGHAMQLSWKDYAGSIEIKETKYELQQCHWHSPSEHTINGTRFDLEAHLVHKSKSGKIAVISIIYKLGHADSFLTRLKEDLINIKDTLEIERTVGIVDPRLIEIGSHKYYRYHGSLTTPPCNETVTWTVTNKVMTVSREQLKVLRKAIHDKSGSNARPLQSINARTIQFYTPEDY
ncbi:alpha carbonic anhydrase 7-like [Impatiens glandulifera]|uniref:alpha carbonic anhydrase 7-like n=1 Tax=Impatiens glandulifera TaxID=253017 RepID=UPI001FB13760|nr:alpha carbonic anhydrase 7-like [Impatiens glandulifera]